MLIRNAAVVQWLVHGLAKAVMWVRFPSVAPVDYSSRLRSTFFFIYIQKRDIFSLNVSNQAN